MNIKFKSCLEESEIYKIEKGDTKNRSSHLGKNYKARVKITKKRSVICENRSSIGMTRKL